jgi:hypothetical protein
MNHKRVPAPGDLIIWGKGLTKPRIGVLLVKEDLYTRMKIASRNYEPKWRWFIEFNEQPPWNYSQNAGVSEESIIEEVYGKLVFKDN